MLMLRSGTSACLSQVSNPFLALNKQVCEALITCPPVLAFTRCCETFLGLYNLKQTCLAGLKLFWVLT